jgi:signal peptidase I
MAKTLDQIRAEQSTQRKKAASSANGKQKKSARSPQTPSNLPHHTLGEIAISWVKTLAGAIVMVMILNGLLIASFVVPTGSMENTVMTGDFLFVNKFIYGPSTPQMIPLANIPLPYYRFPGVRQPQKGDVIVFVFPGNREEAKPQEFQYYLKRCVATSGDVIEIRNKQLFVNGQASSFPTDGKFGAPASITPDDHLFTFPEGKNFTRDNYGPLRIPKKGDVVTLTPENYDEWRVFMRREGHEVRIEGTTIFVDNKPTTQYTVQRDYCFGMGDNRDNSLDSRYWGFVPMENVVGTPLIVYWSWETNLDAGSMFSTMVEKFKTIRLNRLGRVIN